jgi:hypothetical protein
VKRSPFIAFGLALAAAATGLSQTADAGGSCAKPTVQTLVVGGKVKPGSAIIIGGCGFGASLGKVQLFGQFPGGRAQLNVDSWSDSGIGVFVPQDLSGGPDQIARVQVITKAGSKSNADRTVTFETRRERRMITASDTDYECKSADGPDYEHVCKSGNQGYSGSPCGNTVCQLHKSRPVLSGPFAGRDEFVLHLKNGYEYVDHEFWPNAGADFAFPVTPLVGPRPKLEVVKTGTDAKLRVKWVAPRPTGWVEYKLKIFVEGPAGVAYR